MQLHALLTRGDKILRKARVAQRIQSVDRFLIASVAGMIFNIGQKRNDALSLRLWSLSQRCRKSLGIGGSPSNQIALQVSNGVRFPFRV